MLLSDSKDEKDNLTKQLTENITEEKIRSGKVDILLDWFIKPLLPIVIHLLFFFFSFSKIKDELHKVFHFLRKTSSVFVGVRVGQLLLFICNI